MSQYRVIFSWILLLVSTGCFAQQRPTPPSSGDMPSTASAIDLPSRWLSRVQSKLNSLNVDLTKQTEKYLKRMARKEERLQKKLSKTDSVGARSLFAGSTQQYTALFQRLAAEKGNQRLPLMGEYQPYADSLQGMLKYLQANPGKLNTAGLQNSLGQLQTIQVKMQTADQIKDYVRQRKQQIAQYMQQHTNLGNVLGKEYQAWNQDAYYYGRQMQQYKDMLNDPDKIEKQALALLGKLPAFQSFMQSNSELAGMFGLPSASPAPAQALAGLQTRDQVTSLIGRQVSAAGSGGMAAIQNNIQSAQEQIKSLKEKLANLGGGSSDMDVPDFRPNQQKTKTFWRRLEFGANFQTTRTNYFPVTTDLGLSTGYKLNDRSTIGLGASYKVGWGTGIQHIAFSSQGVGLRSYLDIKIKGSFSATGGFEYNYAVPIQSVQQLRQLDNWSKSGIIGVSKTVSMKTRVFKKTKIQLLWDFLSYQQIPRTQPVLFRIGYDF